MGPPVAIDIPTNGPAQPVARRQRQKVCYSPFASMPPKF